MPAPNEELATELVEWLERVGANSSMSRLARMMSEDRQFTTKFILVDFNNLITSGVINVVYKMPKSALLSDVGITEDEYELAKSYLATIPESDKFRIVVSSVDYKGVKEEAIEIHQVSKNENPIMVDFMRGRVEELAAKLFEKAPEHIKSEALKAVREGSLGSFEFSKFDDEQSN